jgi:LPXTG-motif cell wall-anchored protein
VETIEPEDEMFQKIQSAVGCDDSELTVYRMTDKATPDDGYKLYVPLASSYAEKTVSLYSYQDTDDEELLTELETAVEDNVYSADTDSIEYIAVVGKEKSQETGNTITYLILAGLAVIILAGAGGLLWRQKKHNN